jgi:hypothetical protein
MRIAVYTMIAISSFVASSQRASAQSTNESSCLLSALSNGQTATIRGKVGQAPHDMALVIPGCSETVVLMYAGDSESRESSEKLL